MEPETPVISRGVCLPLLFFTFVFVSQEVNKYCKKDYKTLYNVLPERVYVQQIQSVVKEADDKSTDYSSADFT